MMSNVERLLVVALFGMLSLIGTFILSIAKYAYGMTTIWDQTILLGFLVWAIVLVVYDILAERRMGRT